MKKPLQFNPTLCAAIGCTLLGFSLWLFAVQPAAIQPAEPKILAQLGILPIESDPVRNPTRFAIPSPDGFSGTFPPERINVRLALSPITPPREYLQRTGPIRMEIKDQPLTEIVIPQDELQIPSTVGRVQPTTKKETFRLSENLHDRLAGPLSLQDSAPLKTSVRIHLHIKPDGRIGYLLCDPPVNNTALLSEIRSIRFKPAEQPVHGWIDLLPSTKEATR